MTHHKKLCSLFCVLICVLGLSSCGLEVTPVEKAQAQINTSKVFGYILLGLESESLIEEISIIGVTPLVYSPNSAGFKNSFVLAKVPVGAYYISGIKTGIGKQKLKGDLDWSFSITSQEISYIGHININENIQGYSWGYSRVELVNKSSFAYEYILDEHSELLDAMPLRYAGPGDDRFLAHLQKAEF